MSSHNSNTDTVARDLTRRQKFKAWARNNGPITLAACGLTNITIATIAAFVPHTTIQKVVSHRWSRSVTLQENAEKHGDGWKSDFWFIDGVALTCESRAHGHHDCNPHTVVRYDSHGHARLRTRYDRCVTYDDWCHAVWREWTDVSTSETHGEEYNDLWPQTAAVGPLQRLQRSWVYSISFDNGRTVECGHEEYRSIAVGSVHAIRWRRFSNSAELVTR